MGDVFCWTSPEKLPGFSLCMWILGVSEWKNGSCASCFPRMFPCFFSNIPTSDTPPAAVTFHPILHHVCVKLYPGWPSELRWWLPSLKLTGTVGPWKLMLWLEDDEISFSGVWPIFQGQKNCCFLFRESVYILTSHGNISRDVPMNCINHSLNFLDFFGMFYPTVGQRSVLKVGLQSLSQHYGQTRGTPSTSYK